MINNRLREALARLVLLENQLKPNARVNGLVSPCARCGVVPDLDYHVSDAFWNRTVPEEWRTHVVCFECLDQMSEGGVPLDEIQPVVYWTTRRGTLALIRYDTLADRLDGPVPERIWHALAVAAAEGANIQRRDPRRDVLPSTHTAVAAGVRGLTEEPGE